MFGELLGEAEPDIIEECTDINVRFVTGKEQSSTWTIEDTGIVLFLPPDCVPNGTVLSCHVSCDSQAQLDFRETLISRVISLEVDSSVVKEDFTIAIPHSGSTRYEFGSCYENVIKEFCHTSKTWKDADLSTFKNVENKTDYMGYTYMKRPHPEIVKFPSIILKRRCGGTICVISRLRTETIPVGPSGGRLQLRDYPYITVTVEENTFMESANLSLKVLPISHSVRYCANIIFGPVIILSVKSKQDLKMLNPIDVSVYDSIFFDGKETIRILYKKTDAPDGKWIDATNDIPFTVSQYGDIDMHINHLSMFWPVFILKYLVGTEKVIETATSLFSKLYGKSPVRAYFDVRERPNSQVGRKTILDIEVMPWHLAPQLKSNSEEDPFDKEHIMVELCRDGSVTPYNENHQSPFTIRFDSQCRKSKGMHVDLHGNKKCIRSNCYFKSMLGRKSLLCDYPFTLSMDIEKIQPREFCGIPFDESERSYLILLETPCDVLFDCKSNTENQDFKVVIEDTIEKEKKTSERESLKYFYQEISHKDFEQEAFDGLVSSMNDHPGLDHIKSMLFKGRKMVMEPVDEESIDCIVQSAKEDYNAFAVALGLDTECRDIEWMHLSSKDRFIALVHAWRSRDNENATLHVLMKTLVDISCEDGVNDLVQRYKELLETSNSARQDQVFGCLREDMLSSEAIVESASEPQAATDHSTDDSPVPELRPPRVEECDDSETHSRKTIGTIFEQRAQLRRGGDVNGCDRVIAIPVGYIFSSLVLIVAIVIYKYWL